ncbi:hypothetical protein CBM2599_A40181 [Cupriavidus taiwanensis]|nr:hypothetical protein CBM2599_A40181 [Cupriavidus taiwanensis]SOY89855.1 hypothetical protein CBM2600_A50184 [Cupriavidus taiwanensis]
MRHRQSVGGLTLLFRGLDQHHRTLRLGQHPARHRTDHGIEERAAPVRAHHDGRRIHRVRIGDDAFGREAVQRVPLERHIGRGEEIADRRHRLVAGFPVPVVDGFLADEGAHLAAHFGRDMDDMHGEAVLQQLAFGDKACRGVAEGRAVGGEDDIGHGGISWMGAVGSAAAMWPQRHLEPSCPLVSRQDAIQIKSDRNCPISWCDNRSAGPLIYSVIPADAFGHCPVNTAARSMLPSPTACMARPCGNGHTIQPPIPAASRHGARRRRTGDNHHE